MVRETEELIYTVECSICRFRAQTSSTEEAQKIADQHEEITKHQGPFVWVKVSPLRDIP